MYKKYKQWKALMKFIRDQRNIDNSNFTMLTTSTEIIVYPNTIGREPKLRLQSLENLNL